MSGFASAPASSANLGPGFDVLALALSMRCSVTATPADRWAISQDGETTEPDADNLVRRAASLLADGPFHLTIDNAIPRGRGLGSSAAVAVAAGAAALRARGMKPSARRLFEVAAAVDGHADNAAAAVYGGFVAVSDGVVRNLEVHPGLRVVVGIPEAALATSEARAALPAQMSREAAARNLGRIVFLIEGMRSADAAVLAAAAGDEIHEAPRRLLSPRR